jgi:hypothetical protein
MLGVFKIAKELVASNEELFPVELVRITSW